MDVITGNLGRKIYLNWFWKLLIFSKKCNMLLNNMKENALFGCLCPSERNLAACTKIQKLVHNNPCIGKFSFTCK